MKKMPFIVFPILFILMFQYGCGTFQTTSKTTRVITVDEADVAMGEPEKNIPTDPTIVGNDRDEHGCIGSAGYSWSTVQNRCLRIFEEGISLLPTELTTDKLATMENGVLNTYIIFSNDSLIAEIFIPNQPKPILCHKTASSKNEEKWIEQNYKLTKIGNSKFYLFSNSTLIYYKD
jgi:hypothetical protein